MKLSCVLVSCNENTHYLNFWPIVKQAWWNICKVPCLMVYIGNEKPEELKDDAAVILWKPIEGWPTATQAQVIRILFPALLKCDGAVLLSDMDIMPLQKEFFLDSLATFSDDMFVSLRGIDEGEKQIYICYVAATPKTWSEVFGIKTSDDIYNTMKELSMKNRSDGMHGGTGWCTDQLVLYEKVKEWIHKKPGRYGEIPWTREIPRLDRGYLGEWIPMRPETEKKLTERGYIDFHMPPIDLFLDNIAEVFHIVSKHYES
jgi:hypothetical protein